MIVAIASGKGGTGKTTVSVNLAFAAKEDIDLFDCDVEEPNAQLFVQGRKEDEETVSTLVPQVDQSLCNGCGECSRICRFNAIVPCPSETFVFPEMCHSCGGCALACESRAIQEVERRIGVIESFSRGRVKITHGKLDVGQPMAPPLIRTLKKRITTDRTTILDAPPGTSCPVVATVRDAGLVVLVTEPTPFGLNDLELAVDMVRELKLKFAVVINRSGSGDDKVKDYCAREDIPVLAEIPDDRKIAESYSRGEIFSESLPEYKKLFDDLWTGIKELAADRETAQ